MMKLSLVVPDPTTNYIENPNCRFDTTGYNALSATLTRSLDFSRFGIASCRVVTNGTILREGVYYRVNSLAGMSVPVTVSVYVIGTGVVRCRLIDNPIGKEWVSENVTLRTDRFVRLSATGFSTGSNDLRLYVETNDVSAKARTFYVGGLQMEPKAYRTTFCDGDQPGCRWNGLYHESTSQRLGKTRAGGRWVQLAGEEREEQDLYVTVVGGLGMAPIQNHVQSFALEPGGYFQNNKIQERIITLTFHAKHKVDDQEQAISLAALHQLRQLLIDVIKPDRTAGDEDILFEYDDGNIPLYFRARYDGGLEGEWDIRNQWVNSFPLRLLAVSPLLEEDTQVASQLDIQNTTTVNMVMARQNGQWNRMNYGVNNIIYAMSLGHRGQVYAGGDFSVANNNAAAISPSIPARVAYWDGQKWVAIATSLTGASAQIRTIAVAPNGDVYVGGSFTTIHGVAANYIAKYSSGTWSALGTGMNADVYAIAVAPNGDVYAVGNFTTAGGVSCSFVARWDGLQWRRVGQYGGVNALCTSVSVSRDGTRMYLGGRFTREAGGVGATINLIAQYNISAGTFLAMGDGFTSTILGEIFDIVIAESNIIYVSGVFDHTGSTSVVNVAQWRGSQWSSMGAGLIDNPAHYTRVFRLLLLPDGNILAIGLIDLPNENVPINNAALWNGSTWTNFDFNKISVGAGARAGAVEPISGDIFISTGDFIGDPLLFAGVTTVTNLGDAEVSPRLYFKGSGRLKWIENQTTNQRLYMNLVMLANEEIFIDFGTGTIESVTRGPLLFAILPGSDFRAFKLAPGDNTIAVFVHDDVGAIAQMTYTPTHWGVDATQSVESL